MNDPPQTFCEVQSTILERSEADSEEINPLFGKYCQEAEHFYSNGATAEQKALYERSISDYMVLRQACAQELHIMGLNRVGVEKNLKNIINQTAKHVGLAMPKEWDHS